MNAEKGYAEQLRAEIDRELPGLDEKLLDRYTRLGLRSGTNTTMSEVHEAWSIWCAGLNPSHRWLVPFEALPAEVQELDRPYRDGIHRACETVNSRFPAEAADEDEGEMIGTLLGQHVRAVFDEYGWDEDELLQGAVTVDLLRVAAALLAGYPGTDFARAARRLYGWADDIDAAVFDGRPMPRGLVHPVDEEHGGRHA